MAFCGLVRGREIEGGGCVCACVLDHGSFVYRGLIVYFLSFIQGLLVLLDRENRRHWGDKAAQLFNLDKR